MNWVLPILFGAGWSMIEAYRTWPIVIWQKFSLKVGAIGTTILCALLLTTMMEAKLSAELEVSADLAGVALFASFTIPAACLLSLVLMPPPTRKEKEDGVAEKYLERIKTLVDEDTIAAKLLEELREESIVEDISKKVGDRAVGRVEEVVEGLGGDLIGEAFEDADDFAEKIGDKVAEIVVGADSFEKGQSFQRLTCQLLSLLGFEVVNHPPKGMPDHEVSINGSLQFAVGTRQSHETKSRTVKWRDFQSGFNFARGRGVPFMIIWWNSSRDRLWIKVVEPAELDVEDERGFKLTMPKWVWRGEEKYTEQDDKDREKSYRRARAWLRNFMEEIRSP
ncbi:hypothetical protein AKJ65_05990 [candidate division MSBL1 archaeon SCGC-AAA259E19]|uniref:Uncharacterized protein n=1 Tax=candidate division MSBL1 archaeon SCGC-AAA259E19 TaxID=1698264 RepID=A0A133UI05_9EURY|nr:hypothetical protein AKJ65_05990 [candidate division MSBL1 archaeon SCGC-AAA259E19]